MRRKITLFIFSFVLARCYSQVTKCDVDDPGNIIAWNTAIIATDPIDDIGSLNLEFTYRGDLQLEADTEEEGAKYIDVTADGSTLSIKTNDYFKNNYEEDQRNQAPASSLCIFRTLSITCDGTTYPLTIALYVQDTNNHAPTFTQDTYTYVMPMPLVPNIDLTNFGDIEIIAEDIDFSNTKMTFTVDPPEYFALDFKALPSRQYHAVLKVKQYVRYDKDLTLMITATDETDPFNTGTATVVIKKDNDFSQPDIPTFSELIYAFTYSNDGGNPAITPDDPSKEIVVTTSDSDQTEVSLSDETYFKAEYDKTTNIVAISVTNTPVESASESMMTLTLTVKLGSESSESAIIVKLPSNVVVIIPKFTAPYYTATYSVDGDGNPSLALDAGQEIAITQQASNLDVKLEGDDHFSIANVDGVWTLKADSPLQDEILKKGEDITLTLHATVTDENSEEHEGFGVVIVKLPPVLEVPRFVEANYRGQYKVDEAGVKDTVELTNGPINIVQTDETVDIVIVDNTGYFTLIKDTDGWTVDVLKYWEQVTEGGDIVLTLSATVTGADVEPGYSTLIIALPAAAEAPIFDKPYYTATYKTDTNPNTLEMTDIINVAGGDGTVVNFLDSETYSENFDFTLDADPQITVKKPLGDDVISQHQEVLLTLQVSLEGSTDDVETAVIELKLPHLDIPKTLKFNNPSFVFSYIVEGDTHSIDQKGQTIRVTNAEMAAAVIIMEGTHSDNFKVNRNDEDDTYSIIIAKNLEQSVIDSEVDILLVLDASLVLVYDGFATVLINLPAKEAGIPPQFKNTFYVGNYVLGEEKDGDRVDTFMIDGDQISLNDGISEDISVTLGGTNSQFFNAVLNDDKSVTVSLKNNLDLKTILGEVDIVLTLQATDPAVTEVGTAALVVELPKEVTPAAFTQVYYTGSYDVDNDPDVVKINEAIELSGNYLDSTTVVLVTPTGLEDKFKLSVASPYTITLTGDIDDVHSYNEIVLTLEASIDGVPRKTSATVVIEVPSAIALPPKFSSPLYEFKYDSDSDTVTSTDGKTITIDASDPSLVLIRMEGPYTNYFNIIYEATGVCILEVANPLNPAIIDQNVEIFIVLNAVISDSSDTSSTIIAIKMPEKTGNVPLFSESYYKATYTPNESGPDIVTIPDVVPITIVSDQASDTVVKVIGQYEDNFQAEFNSNTKSWDITVINKLDDDILNVYTELVITLGAVLSGETGVGTAALILFLPDHVKEPVPLFEEASYNAQYDLREDGTPEVTGDLIVVKAADPKYVEVTLAGYTDNFILTPNENNSQWTISSSGKPLDDDTLKNNAHLVITLNAHLDNAVADGVAILVVTLPHD